MTYEDFCCKSLSYYYVLFRVNELQGYSSGDDKLISGTPLQVWNILKTSNKIHSQAQHIEISYGKWLENYIQATTPAACKLYKYLGEGKS